MADCPSTRIGVAGYGYWGSKHVRVLTSLSGVEVTVIEPDEERRRRARADHPGVGVVRDLDDMLDGLDGVVVVTPPATHARLALKALGAKVPTLVEKPLVLLEEDGVAVVEAARAAGVQLMVGHVFAYDAAVRKLRDVIASGELGRVLHIDCARLSLGRYRQDCDVVWDLAPHDISIVAHLLGELPATVSAWTHRAVRAAHADVAHLRLDFAEAGVPAFVHVSWLAPEKVRRITVVGEKKTAVYDDLAGDERLTIHDVGVELPDGDGGTDAGCRVVHRSGDIVSRPVPGAEPLMVQDAHFVDCVRAGTSPATPGEQGLAVVRVLAAADRAASTGTPAAVPRRRTAAGTEWGRRSVEVAS
jgi:predicted dehydrogenase